MYPGNAAPTNCSARDTPMQTGALLESILAGMSAIVWIGQAAQYGRLMAQSPPSGFYFATRRRTEGTEHRTGVH